MPVELIDQAMKHTKPENKTMDMNAILNSINTLVDFAEIAYLEEQAILKNGINRNICVGLTESASRVERRFELFAGATEIRRSLIELKARVDRGETTISEGVAAELEKAQEKLRDWNPCRSTCPITRIQGDWQREVLVYKIKIFQDLQNQLKQD